MLITKFNALIRNKIVWAIFALIVAIVFVGSSLEDEWAPQNTQTSGTLYGEDVSERDFRMARFFELGMRESVASTSEMEEHIRKRTWRRLAALRTADRIGLSVSDDEVREAIRQDPSFAADGVFNKQRYRTIIESQLRIGIQLFEAYLRQELHLRKIRGVAQSILWTSPSDLTDSLTDLTDNFIVEHTTIGPADHTSDVDVGREGALTFFEERPDLFRIPEKVSVRYVAFPITNYMAETRIGDAQARKYYEEHIEEYSTVGTNGESSARPLEDVKDDIIALLELDAAILKAKDEATEFVVSLVPDHFGYRRTWEDAAAALGMTTFTSEFFAADEAVPGLDVDRNFNKAAFNLTASDQEGYFSDAIVSTSAVYVIAANEKRETRIPDFDEVADRAETLAERAAKREAFIKKSAEIKASIKSALETGLTFTEAAAKYDLTVVTTESFTAYQGLSNDTEYSDILLPRILPLEQGEMTDALAVEDGALLAYVSERKPGDAGTIEWIRPQLTATLDRYNGEILLADWCDHVLSNRDSSEGSGSGGQERDMESALEKQLPESERRPSPSVREDAED